MVLFIQGLESLWMERRGVRKPLHAQLAGLVVSRNRGFSATASRGRASDRGLSVLSCSDSLQTDSYLNTIFLVGKIYKYP
jgi:hypothetical protein